MNGDDEGSGAAVGEWEPTADDIEYAMPADDEQVRVPVAQEPGGAPRRPEFALLTDTDLETVPPPEYQVDGLIVLESNVFIYGAPGSGKSFLAIEIGRSIAAGRCALGLQTVQGPVVYVAAEGSKRGIAKRVRAWSAAKNDGAPVPDFFIIPRPVAMLDSGTVRRFIDDVAAQAGPNVGMFIFDTLARCTLGGDENSAADMGRFVAACDTLRATFGATIGTVHHSGKAADAGMRGSTALHGSADTEIRVTRESATGIITVACTKQKDDDPLSPLRLRLDAVPDHGSCVLRRADGVGDPEPDVLDKPELRHCLAALRSLGPRARWRDWIEKSGLSNATFNRYRSELVRSRAVQADGDFYRVTPGAENRL